MSIFQCDECGCAENTATGWYHCRNMERLTATDKLGLALCSVCAPLEFPSGEKIEGFNGQWHGHFKQTFLPHGEFFTNQVGNLEHKKTGLVGDKAYKAFGSDKPYPKPVK